MTREQIDVTDKIELGSVDDELVPITKCVCGAEFEWWHFYISIYPDTPYGCPKCGREFYFENTVKVYQVTRGASII